MSINGHHVYWEDGFTQQQNHQRVVRLLREIDCQSHGDRRQTAVYKTHERRGGQSLLAHLSQGLRKLLQAFQ